MTMELESRIDASDALADRILHATVQCIESGEIEAEDAGIAYLAVAVQLLAQCSPHETVARILRANADVVEREMLAPDGTQVN